MKKPERPRIIPWAWLVTPGWAGAEVSGIVVHWTAGAYRVSELDRQHYHVILGSRDGTNGVGAVRGVWTPRDNEYTGDGRYAAHCLGMNTKRIGLSVACMAGATAGNAGRYPLTEVLWERLAEAAAELCDYYGLEVGARTVTQHGEVQRVFGKPQRGKWDVTFKPWEPHLTNWEVCDEFRRMVNFYLKAYHQP